MRPTLARFLLWLTFNIFCPTLARFLLWHRHTDAQNKMFHVEHNTKSQ